MARLIEESPLKFQEQQVECSYCHALFSANMADIVAYFSTRTHWQPPKHDPSTSYSLHTISVSCPQCMLLTEMNISRALFGLALREAKENAEEDTSSVSGLVLVSEICSGAGVYLTKKEADRHLAPGETPPTTLADGVYDLQGNGYILVHGHFVEWHVPYDLGRNLREHMRKIPERYRETYRYRIASVMLAFAYGEEEEWKAENATEQEIMDLIIKLEK